MAAKKTLIDYDGGTNPVYVGETQAGEPSPNALQIAKITYDANGNATSVLYAIGAWADRASLSYS